jgi:GH25 family lysozyme M1 (1,4-beta-N-acetylmuramidase)
VSFTVGEDRSSFQAGGQSWSQNAFGFCKATEGTGWTDPTFAGNWANLKAEGKHRGAYHFFHPADSPAVQAEFFVNYVSRHGGFNAGDMFVADVELMVGDDGFEVPGTANATVRMHEQLKPHTKPLGSTGNLARQFLDEIAVRVGPACPVVVYSYLSMAQGALGSCNGYPLFVAYFSGSPPANVEPWANWVFWQHADHGGQGGGDADFFNGDAAELSIFVGDDWTEALVNNLPTLQLGSKDTAGKTFYVRRLQNDVAGYGRWNGLGKVAAITDDGVFGPSTKLAVQAVQAHAGIGKDGVAGKDTWTVLIAG